MGQVLRVSAVLEAVKDPKVTPMDFVEELKQVCFDRARLESSGFLSHCHVPLKHPETGEFLIRNIDEDHKIKNAGQAVARLKLEPSSNSSEILDKAAMLAVAESSPQLQHLAPILKGALDDQRTVRSSR